jgi:hypothetical protein
LRELVANVPDHQVDEEMMAGTSASSFNNNSDNIPQAGKKPSGRSVLTFGELL